MTPIKQIVTLNFACTILLLAAHFGSSFHPHCNNGTSGFATDNKRNSRKSRKELGEGRLGY